MRKQPIALEATIAKEKEELIFYYMLSGFIDAGVPLIQSLNIVANDFIENKQFSEKVKAMSLQIKDGSNFADALEKTGFQLFLVKIVEAGETGGILDSVLTRYADFLKEKAKLKSFANKNMWEFCRKLGMLLLLGVPYLDALDILSKENFPFANDLLTVKEEVASGKSLASGFKNAGFPNALVAIAEIGESVAALDIILSKYADILKLTA